MRLIEVILASGADELLEEYAPARFAGDDLLAACRARGLPIGNLTAEFSSNCYLHPTDRKSTLP
jgi:RNA-directed DNA polymerase